MSDVPMHGGHVDTYTIKISFPDLLLGRPGNETTPTQFAYHNIHILHLSTVQDSPLNLPYHNIHILQLSTVQDPAHSIYHTITYTYYSSVLYRIAHSIYHTIITIKQL